jgi:hypothetical protein
VPGARERGAGLIAAGIVVTLVAAALQARRWLTPFTLVWTFDHNGLFHMVQMLGLGLILPGLRAGMRDRAARG